MTIIRPLKVLFVVILLPFLLCPEGMSQDGASLFKPCAACHSIGKGRLVGPDLKGVTKTRSNEWLVSFIQSSTRMVKSGDPIARALLAEYNNVPMPDNILTPVQINQLLVYIGGGKAGTEAIDPRQVAMQRRIDSLFKTNSQQDILTGRDLFSGENRFTNGGASCITCHNATFNQTGGGGLLAKDLTKAFSRLGGFAGLKGIIATPPFPSMSVTYKKSPVTEEEVAYLQLFLKSTDSQNISEPVALKGTFLRQAILAGLLLACIILMTWFRRRHQSVNHDILKRQERRSR